MRVTEITSLEEIHNEASLVYKIINEADATFVKFPVDVVVFWIFFFCVYMCVTRKKIVWI